MSPHNYTQQNDTQDNDTQQNGTQENDIQQNDTQENVTQQNDTQQNYTKQNDTGKICSTGRQSGNGITQNGAQQKHTAEQCDGRTIKNLSGNSAECHSAKFRDVAQLKREKM